VYSLQVLASNNNAPCRNYPSCLFDPESFSLDSPTWPSTHWHVTGVFPNSRRDNTHYYH